MDGERLDIIIFGATGFTGKHCIKQAVKLSKNKPFTWGIAGRNKERLDAVLKEFAPESTNVPVIVADIKDDESLKNMTKRCRVLANCCGPYRFYGEPVVKACIATKTSCVDVNGEPQFMEGMQLNYNKAAQDAGVYIISACGFDSIPCDLGIIFLQQNFGGDVNSVETYLTSENKSNVKSAVLHYGTWESAVYGLAHANELGELRRKLFPKRLPEFHPKLRPKRGIHTSTVTEGWSIPFLGSDRSVAYRSQRFLFEKYNMRPAQVQTYMTISSLFTIIGLACFGFVFSIMTKFQCGRNLLLKHPKFFSAGYASHEGPLPEAMENTHFSITFKGVGWKEKLSNPTDKHSEAPNKEMITKTSGVNPGYGATCMALISSALTVLRESDKMPDNGGVLPPGAAFSKTSLIQQLHQNGLTFEVLKTIEK